MTDGPDQAYQLLRRELVRAQARLKRAERERDQALADAVRLRARLRDHGIMPPDTDTPDTDTSAAPDGASESSEVTRRPGRS